MKIWLVTGREEGDDEDTLEFVFADSYYEAVEQFKLDMARGRRETQEAEGEEPDDYEVPIYINWVLEINAPGSRRIDTTQHHDPVWGKADHPPKRSYQV